MKQIIENTVYTLEAVKELSTPLANDYGEILHKHGAQYETVGNYLQVGKIEWVQGWIINISVIRPQLPDLLDTIIPLLLGESVPFKVVENEDTAMGILNGTFGYTELGKLVSIYPRGNDQSLSVAQKLLKITQSFRGPRVLTDRHLGSVIHTRHGSCRPLIRISENGNQEQFIYDSSGQLIKDIYTIPFVLPSGVIWPFSSITSSAALKPETTRQDKYKTMSVLKVDVKGSVKKALWLEKLYRVKWCIIKEGKRNMIADLNGRDIGERLRWQFELHNDLCGFIPIPKVYEYFEEDGDSYLSMEYIKGRDLDSIISSTFGEKKWDRLTLSDRLLLLNYASQILDIIQRMHWKGYIHRDITPLNFLVDRDQQIWMIDLELSFSQQHNKPFPPFRLGTPGFMSPEQEAVILPTIQQDIYALGGILISLLTGLLPFKFATKIKETLKDQLAFFIPNQQLIENISNCFDPIPELRPTIEQLKLSIEQFLVGQEETPTQKSHRHTPLTKEDISGMLTNAIKGMTSPAMMSPEDIWLSKAEQQEGMEYYQSESTAVFPGFYEGLSGILYLLARAHKVGISIRPCLKGYDESRRWLRYHCLQRLSETPAGLYGGTAGIALALIEGINSGVIPDNEETTREIQAYLNHDKISGNGIVKGVAGQGMVLLQAGSTLKQELIGFSLKKHVAHLLQQQQKDGSWTSISTTKKDILKVTGFGHGVSGLVCFLLGYIKLYNDTDAQKACIKALNWLTKQQHKVKGQVIWYINDKSKDTDPGMQDGVIGIILTLIKAFALIRDPCYHQLAEQVLRSIPHPWVNRDLTLANGLAGVGELYLEAAGTFRSDEWQERADWIATFLLHHYQQKKDKSIFWMSENTQLTSPALLTGNAGVIHFLLRYYRPDLLSHPLCQL